MTTALWAIVAAVAVLWPGRLAGPLDGAPLDGPLEALVIGVLLPWLLIANARLLRRPAARALIVTLLAWKAVTGAALTQDGWCLRFTSPVPIYLDDVRVPPECVPLPPPPRPAFFAGWRGCARGWQRGERSSNQPPTQSPAQRL